MKGKSDFDFVIGARQFVGQNGILPLKKKTVSNKQKDSNVCIGYQDHY